MPDEVELKLAIDAEQIWRLQRHPRLRAVTRRKLPAQRLYSIYYDTPQLDLKNRGLAVRLRRLRDRWFQTIKAQGKAVAGLHERPEWETETQDNTLDFNSIPDPRVKTFLAAEAIRENLRPAFATDVTRTRRLLALAGGDLIEFALDRGEIRAEASAVPVCEVELELKSGHSASLFELALDLLQTIPLRIENRSKAERGFQLVSGAALAPVKPRTPPLDAALSAEAAFTTIVEGCITHLQANERGVLQEADDPEYVHQMRVALRRLRSALNLFAPLVPKQQAAPIVTELRWLTAELNDARDWDVFALETLPRLAALQPNHAGLQWLGQSAQLTRRQHDARASTAVGARRYQGLLLGLGAWLARRPWRDDAAATVKPETPVIEFAASVLQERHRKLRKSAKELTNLPADQRHATRIAAKKLRYAGEFFASLYPRKNTRHYIDALADLQDVLGRMNDCATAFTLVDQMRGNEKEQAHIDVLGMARGFALGASDAQIGALNNAGKRFRRQNTFW